MPGRFFALAVCVVAFSMSATAGTRSSKVVDGWIDRMADTVTLLKAEDYPRALRLANRTVAEMVDMLGPGDAATELFGIALTHKALAHAGLRQNDDALWYWHTVLSLYPKFEESDISMFGKAGAFLEENVKPPPVPESEDELEGDITPPKLLRRPKPDYPRGALWFGVSGALVVEVLVTKDGQIKSPRVLEPLPAPTLSYVALDALRRWRFRPALVAGKPVACFFRLTVNYKAD